MASPHALILRCRVPAVAERLVGVYAGLLSQNSFPFRFQIHINPPDSIVNKLTQSHRCLFFLQVEPDITEDIERWIAEVNTVHRAAGHQLVLVAEESADYLDLAIRFQVGNILFLESINASTVGALTHRLLGDDFFGFAPFFPNHWHRFEQHLILTGRVNLAGIVDRHFGSFLASLSEPYRHRFHGQISELLTNAIAYGILGITPEQRDTHTLHVPPIVEIPVGKEIKISVVQDDEKYGISVKDPGGSLTLLRILQKLRRHTPRHGHDLPVGLEDLTGRGLFIVSRQTRIVVNILRNMQTEVILLGYFNEDNNRYKSMIINEKFPDRG